jgi:NAD(P)-dependent dehydrogenase (short-subunit alcohol dehydrogenase family)
MDRFTEKRVFITGAASGLGRAFAERFAIDGWKVAIADINLERLAETKEILDKIGTTTLEIECDVTSHDALVQAAELIENSWGGVDIVINNAGIAGVGRIEDISLGDWKRLLDIDLWSVIYGCSVFIPMLKRQGKGHIVNTASAAGIGSAPEMANYNVAKAGVISLSETLKVELAGQHIGVTVIAPTVFKANLVDQFDTDPKGMGKSLLQQMEKSKVSASEIVEKTIKAIEKDRLYVVPQIDAKIMWWIKRLSPEFFSRVMAFLYRKRLWLFADLD